jgi:hypothetical protein
MDTNYIPFFRNNLMWRRFQRLLRHDVPSALPWSPQATVQSIMAMNDTNRNELVRFLDVQRAFQSIIITTDRIMHDDLSYSVISVISHYLFYLICRSSTFIFATLSLTLKRSFKTATAARRPSSQPAQWRPTSSLSPVFAIKTFCLHGLLCVEVD